MEKEGAGLKEEVEAFIEHNKLWIGGFLLLLIVGGYGFLVYKENFLNNSVEIKVQTLEAKLSMLEKEQAKTDRAQIGQAQDEMKPKEGAETIQTPDKESESILGAGGRVAGTNSSKGTKPNTAVAVSAKVNINTATENELDTLPGIGATYAKRIIEYRNANGPFGAIEDIKKVKGIGEKTFEKFKDRIIVN